MEWDSQRSSISSNPNSITSQTGSNNSQRTDKVPTLQQISPSPSVSALSKLTDDDLRRKGLEDLVRIVRRIESDYKSLLAEHGNIVKDVNRRYQIFVLESRGLKEVNQKLQDDNQELRDLCCFLDDDRQRGRKLAREWQRFGRYTASVMRSEVAVYQEKLHELEERQCELVKENVELKELCLFLDQERGRISGDRDEGDGSSNGTVTGQEDGVISMDTSGSNTQTPSYNTVGSHSSGSTNYIRELEQKVQKLEEEKRILAQRMTRNSAEGLDDSMSTRENTLVHDDELMHGSDGSKSPKPRKPEAVVHAMKVLQVHEELEKIPTAEENLDDTEKAIVREMCNVVWRKLGDVGDVVSFNDSSDSILDPPAIPSSSTATAVNPAAHGQSHSFNVSQPQPQMASTPLSTNVKTVSGDYPHGGGNQKYQTERQAKVQPLRPSQASNQHPYYQPLPHQTDVNSRNLPSNVDIHETRPPGKPDDQNKGEQDRVMKAYPFSMPQPFPRPSSQPQPRDFKPIPSQSQQPPSQPVPHLPTSSEENVPPHFQSHRQRHLQQQQPQPQPPPPTLHSQQHPYFLPPNQSNVSRKSHSPINEKPQPYVHRTDSSSSTPASVPYSSNPPYQYPQQLTSSQQYPHHPVRLLEAPGSQSHRGPGVESRMPGDDKHQILNKPASSHPENNFSRRDAARSEPNVSVPGGYRGGRDRDMLHDHRETSASQMALRQAGDERDRKGPPGGKLLRGHPTDSSSAQHLLPSHQQTQPSQIHSQSGNNPQASHPVKGGFRAYPRSGLPMSMQAPVSLSHPSSANPHSRMTYSQPVDPSSRAPATRSDSSKVYQQQEWRQTYLDDSDTL